MTKESVVPLLTSQGKLLTEDAKKAELLNKSAFVFTKKKIIK